MRVEDVMTHDVVTAHADMTLKEAAREMAARGISGMPVVDGDGHASACSNAGSIASRSPAAIG
jgi:CBS domain-containing protein